MSKIPRERAAVQAPQFVSGRRCGARITVNVSRIVSVTEDGGGMYRVEYDVGRMIDGYSTADIWASGEALRAAGVPI